ncbi:hypothetical protein SJI00_07075 [Pseudomonas sp. RP23018S]|uniref:hypothetical protein n=1 Tax=Pseudomonas sp. RP23018S TaxID=3096037 RepID=UPI002ACAE3D6|nr:hypothetical protein [Pseudomonas sp. RP23018S]MDZ5602532.1 hypothetical protein [Pseudomonas sp. RP23018S]
MSNITIDADIKVKMAGGHRAYSPASPEELMLIAVDLLVRELGSDAARTFMGQVIERHAPSSGVSAATAKQY